MKKSSILALLLCFLLSGCSNTKEYTRYDRSTLNSGFDTVITLATYETTQSDFDEKFQITSDLFIHYNNLFDIYHEYDGMNNLKTINDHSGIEPVEVDQEIIDLLLEAREFTEMSQGEFDVTMGAELQVWHNYRTAGIEKNLNGEYAPLPSEEELAEAQACRGWEHVEIDDEANTVFITNSCVSLDVGGIAKGYATEQVAQKLESLDTYAGFVNAGGNNRLINSKPDGNPWVSGITHPDQAGEILIFEVEGSSSIVTSGDYERFFIAEDKTQYHHIIDPTTGYPATYYRSVSIVTSNSGHADILSTSLYTMSIEDGKQMIQRYLETYPENELEVIWMMQSDLAQEDSNGVYFQDYYITSTDGLKDKITFVQ